jgi:hypothetical protein
MGRERGLRTALPAGRDEQGGYRGEPVADKISAYVDVRTGRMAPAAASPA